MDEMSHGENAEVAAGEVDGRRWWLRWVPGGHRDGLLFSAEAAFGHLRPLGDEPVRFAVTALGDSSLVWGLAPPDAIAVRVLDSAGAATVEPVTGPDCDGASAFVVVLPAGHEPHGVQLIRVDGSVGERHEVFPEPTDLREVADRIAVRAVHRDAGRGRGHVVLEGTVDDGTWDFSAQLFEGTLHTSFQHLHPYGGGHGSGGGPLPVPTAGVPMGLSGAGSGGRYWNLTGWADPAVAEVVLQLRSGERLHLPVGGHELDAGFVLFAVALPTDALALFAEGFDADGRTVGRLDLRGFVGAFG